MSNALFEAHDTLGSPCGENADLDEIADWAGSVLLRSLTNAWFPWRPINSAPQDGTAILVYAEGVMAVVRWIDPPDSENGWWHVDDNKHGPFALRGPSPTHWLSLPPPPEIA